MNSRFSDKVKEDIENLMDCWNASYYFKNCFPFHIDIFPPEKPEGEKEAVLQYLNYASKYNPEDLFRYVPAEDVFTRHIFPNGKTLEEMIDDNDWWKEGDPWLRKE